MKCKLCKVREANKKNTHYLTDSIIRTCLNLDGSNNREAGFYFDISNNTPFVNFNFQRGTSVVELEKSLGRSATDEEIEKAKQIPFSVDNVFCSVCENIFTSIETPFVTNILPRFRQTDLTGIQEIDIPENKIVKLFFYLQIWRNAICENDFVLNEDTLESLRLTILNSSSIENDDLPIFPFHMTYLQTTGDEKEYTSNFVGSTNDRNPNIIFLNDFVIQFFETSQAVQKIEFYNLNQSDDFDQFISTDNTQVKFKIIPNDTRLEILGNIAREEKVQTALTYFTQNFTKLWFSIFNGFPHPFIIQEYLNYISARGFNILQYTEESIIKKTTDYIETKVK
ncbi:hypothetical protein [Cellulophaga baltica]|uniref:hypothetical protein n=1 Tax=Cellulophaga baltica TaxID=76594 RepID=UPI00047003D8|nr:hypothetical protein [Cellulophaga baltica]AIY11985.1 hypothetical protein M667_01415 [Cellulophaga baltica NN016038]